MNNVFLSIDVCPCLKIVKNRDQMDLLFAGSNNFCKEENETKYKDIGMF